MFLLIDGKSNKIRNTVIDYRIFTLNRPIKRNIKIIIYHFKIIRQRWINKDFIRSLLFDENNALSAAYSLERAYDNGIVLREEISTDSLSFLQMAKDTLTKAGKSDNVRLALLPLEDIIYSFWGSINEHIFDDEIRNIIYIGKTLERLDLYIRMKYPFDIVEKEFVRLCKNLNRVPKGTPYRYSTKQLSVLVEILGSEEDYKREADRAVDSLGHLFETEEVFV